MITRLEACQQARKQFRALFTSMAADPAGWHLYATKEGVELAQNKQGDTLVRHVACLTEDMLVNRLDQVLRKGSPHVWTQGDNHER